jgi:hypothetical protein
MLRHDGVGDRLGDDVHVPPGPRSRYGVEQHTQFFVDVAYGTAGFPTALLPLDARETLRAANGAEAEGLVYQYCSCDRQATYPAFGSDPIAFVDRFTGATSVVGAPDLEPFAVITLANELDIARARAFETRSVDGLHELCAALAPYVPTEARVAREETDRHE